MDILLIFDSHFAVDDYFKKYLKKILPRKPTRVHLFSLTSNFLVIDDIKKQLQTHVTVEIIEINAAALINQAVTHMQSTIHTWSESIGNLRWRNRSLKEWLLYPDKTSSAWWLGLLSEKNTVQDAVFFHIAQVNAIHQHLINANYDACMLHIDDDQKKKIIRNTLKRLNIHIWQSSQKNKRCVPFKQKCLSVINQFHSVAALFNLLRFIKDSLVARTVLPNRTQRISAANQHTFAFVTYFPNLDEHKAKAGVFINHYAGALQNTIQQAEKPMIWLTMPVFYNGHRFRAAIHFARRFIQHGEHLFVLAEFFSPLDYCKSMVWWLKQALLSEVILHRIAPQQLWQNLTYQEALPYVHYLWRHSFMGTSAMRGIIFYLSYQRFFAAFPKLNQCLYFCEMQAWEKALLMAKKKINPHLHTYAFQHTVVMKNFFNYFYSANDLQQNNCNTDMPLPNRLIANGNLPYKLLSAYNYPNLCLAEAIRQLYLYEFLDQSQEKRSAQQSEIANEIVLLIVGSCDAIETKSLISLVYRAFPNTHLLGFKIAFKESPVNPLAPLFQELNIDFAKAGYQIYKQELSHLLAKSKMALSANTTVAIEAAAFGCEVMVPIFADTMLLNPIVETDAHYHLVYHVDGFKTLVNQSIFAKRQKSMNNELITACWHLDPTLRLWKELLIHGDPRTLSKCRVD